MATATKPAEDLFTLANRLRDKGLDDDRLVEALTGLGFTKAQARDAAASTAPPAAAEPVVSEGSEVTPSASDTATRQGGRARTGSSSRTPRTPRRAAPRGSGQGGIGSSLRSVEKSIDKGLREAGSLSLRPPRRLTVQAGAGFAGGLLLYVLALNYLRYGPEGVSGWFAAKFVNRPMSPIEKGFSGPLPKGDPGDAGKRSGLGPRIGLSDRPSDYLPTTRPRRPVEV